MSSISRVGEELVEMLIWKIWSLIGLWVLSMSVSWKIFWICLISWGFLNWVSTFILYPGRGGVGLNCISEASFWTVLSPIYRLVYHYMKISPRSCTVIFLRGGCGGYKEFCPVFILLCLLKNG